MNLTEFLLARIAEDEATMIGFAVSRRYSRGPGMAAFWRHRELELHVKRAIVKSKDASPMTLRWLAVSYLDHPDYDKTWTP